MELIDGISIMGVCREEGGIAMERLTHPRNSGIKTGYWSPNKKDTVTQCEKDFLQKPALKSYVM